MQIIAYIIEIIDIHPDAALGSVLAAFVRKSSTFHEGWRTLSHTDRSNKLAGTSYTQIPWMKKERTANRMPVTTKEIIAINIKLPLV